MQQIEIPTFTKLQMHLNSEGHKNSHIAWHKGLIEIPKFLFMPQTNKSKLTASELEADKLYVMQEIKKGAVHLRKWYLNGVVPRSNYHEFWDPFLMKICSVLDIHFDNLDDYTQNLLNEAFKVFKKDFSRVKSACIKKYSKLDVTNIMAGITLEKGSGGKIKQVVYKDKTYKMDQIKNMSANDEFKTKDISLFKANILNSTFMKEAYSKFTNTDLVKKFEAALKTSSLIPSTQKRYIRDFALFNKFMKKQKELNTIQTAFELYKKLMVNTLREKSSIN